MIIKNLIAGSFFLFPQILIAQTTFTGSILYKDDSSPAPYVNVTVAGQHSKTNFKAVCDEKGHFSFSELPDDDYRLQVTYFEHDTLNEMVTIRNGEPLKSILYIAQPKWIKDMKQAEQQKARQDSLEYSNRKYRAKRHQPKY